MDFKNYKKSSDIYPIIPDFEIEWLKQEMYDKDLQYVIFSHHSLANDFPKRGIANREEIREILSTRKTVLCMNGHDHGDACSLVNGIPYFTLNSMSYIWHGMKESFAFSKDIHKQYSYLKDMILYKDVLYCIVEVDENAVSIKGLVSDYMNISPEDMGIVDYKWNGVSILPVVSDYHGVN